MIRSTMAGTVVEVRVAPGDRVKEGQEVVILDSMKMQLPVPSPVAGAVKAVRVSAGDFVNEGDPLVELE